MKRSVYRKYKRFTSISLCYPIPMLFFVQLLFLTIACQIVLRLSIQIGTVIENRRWHHTNRWKTKRPDNMTLCNELGWKPSNVLCTQCYSLILYRRKKSTISFQDGSNNRRLPNTYNSSKLSWSFVTVIPFNLCTEHKRQLLDLCYSASAHLSMPLYLPQTSIISTAKFLCLMKNVLD